MRKKPNAQNTNVKISEPIATAPMCAGFGIWPTTAVSTTPINGPDRFASIAGPASVSTARCVSTGRADASSLTGWRRPRRRTPSYARSRARKQLAGVRVVRDSCSNGHGRNYGTERRAGAVRLEVTARALMC